MPLNHPAVKWLNETVASVRKASNIPDSEQGTDEVMKGRQLATQWQALTDEDLKQTARVLIRHYWQQKDWWRDPPKGAARKSRPLYGDDDPAEA